MLTFGLIREGKIPSDNRVALSPAHCKFINKTQEGIEVIVQHSDSRCYTDKEYERAGAVVKEDISECDILLGIKEVPIEMLIPNKTYLFFSHTKKLQPYTQKLIKAIIAKKITLIDYKCLEHEDGKRIIGFGFFAGVVGALGIGDHRRQRLLAVSTQLGCGHGKVDITGFYVRIAERDGLGRAKARAP